VETKFPSWRAAIAATLSALHVFFGKGKMQTWSPLIFGITDTNAGK
jgi:hypothetical protein